MGVKEVFGLLPRLLGLRPSLASTPFWACCPPSDGAEFSSESELSSFRLPFVLIEDIDVEGFNGEGVLGANDALLPTLAAGEVFGLSLGAVEGRRGLVLSDNCFELRDGVVGDDGFPFLSSAKFLSAWREEPERPACIVSWLPSTF